MNIKRHCGTNRSFLKYATKRFLSNTKVIHTSQEHSHDHLWFWFILQLHPFVSDLLYGLSQRPLGHLDLLVKYRKWLDGGSSSSFLYVSSTCLYRQQPLGDGSSLGSHKLEQIWRRRRLDRWSHYQTHHHLHHRMVVVLWERKWERKKIEEEILLGSTFAENSRKSCKVLWWFMRFSLFATIDDIYLVLWCEQGHLFHNEIWMRHNFIFPCEWNITTEFEEINDTCIVVLNRKLE